MTVLIRLVFILLMSVVANIENARILAYFPTPSISHQVVFRPITQELAKRGHEVTVVTANPVFSTGTTPTNLTEIDVQEISYDQWKLVFNNHTGRKIDLLFQALSIMERFSAIFELQMKTPQVQNMLKDKNKNYFDLLLLESCNRPLIGMANKFEAPVILLSSLGASPFQFDYLGAPSHPLLYSTPGRQRLYNLSPWEKAFELIKQWVFDAIFSYTERYDFSIAKRIFGDDLPSFQELAKRVQMMILNEHPIWSENRPVPPSIQFMGGIHQPVDKELPQDLKEFLDTSKNGVIYVSFGTNIIPSLLPQDRIQLMSKVFSKLPYGVLWKLDKETLIGQSKNIKISKWVPQTDVLRHPNVKLFITQGGLQSSDEAIDAGVPLIGIPMLADQWYNVEKYVRFEIGRQLDISEITEIELKNAIELVINDKRYKDNILKLRTLMRSYRIKPLDNVIWWIEHVIAHGGRHLQSPAAHISLAEYYEVKLVITAVALIVALLVLIYIALKFLLNLLFKIFKRNMKVKVK